jgi:hypothetical protein
VELAASKLDIIPYLFSHEIVFKESSSIKWLALVTGVFGDVQGCGSRPKVAEHKPKTSPRMRIGNFNVTGIALSSFELGVNINYSLPILKIIDTINAANARNSVNTSIVVPGGDRVRLKFKGTG